MDCFYLEYITCRGFYFYFYFFCKIEILMGVQKTDKPKKLAKLSSIFWFSFSMVQFQFEFLEIEIFWFQFQC